MTGQFSLRNIPITDSHCHPFLPIERQLTLTDLCLLLHVGPRAVETASEEQKRAWKLKFAAFPPIIVPRLILELGKLYWGEDWVVSELAQDAEAVLTERYRRAQKYPEYLKFLFDDIRLQKVIVDTGYPRPPVDLGTFTGSMNCEVQYIFRSESLTDELLNTKETFSDFLAAWDVSIDQALRDPQCVGLKSIIAYRAGLDVRPVTKNEAAGNHDAYRRDATTGLKPLLDFLFVRALERVNSYDKVLQVHTGMGDTDIIAEKAHPMCLFELLKQTPFSQAKVVLVHGGFPWVSEAAAMAGLLANVYLDLSLSCSFFPLRTGTRLLEALEQAPPQKIMHGSDGIALPELIWLGGKLCKESLTEIFDELIRKKKSSIPEAEEISKLILYRNAELLYNPRLS
jgi:predicted TIM-barrel fold metal-dependent hydrolase